MGLVGVWGEAVPLSIEVRPVISLGESKCKRGPGQLQGFSQVLASPKGSIGSQSLLLGTYRTLLGYSDLMLGPHRNMYPIISCRWHSIYVAKWQIMCDWAKVVIYHRNGMNQTQVLASNSYMWRQCAHITTNGVLLYTYMHVKIPFVNACDSHMTTLPCYRKRKNGETPGWKPKYRLLRQNVHFWSYTLIVIISF